MVVVSALGARLRVAPGPHARVHGKDERFVHTTRDERMTAEELAQGFGVDPSAVQRGVEAAPAATVGGLEAQVRAGEGAAPSAARRASVSSKRASALR
jgi:hypothetical protein